MASHFLAPFKVGTIIRDYVRISCGDHFLDVSCRGQEVECESQHRGNHIAQSSTIRIPREYQECL